jgi:YHS domain-containing protein
MLRSAITFVGVLALLALPSFTFGCKTTGTPAVPTAGEAAAAGGGAASAALEIGNPHAGFCPVMGEAVDIAKAEATPGLQSDYQGKRYLFCCPGCKETFEKDPMKYITTPAEPKK